MAPQSHPSPSLNAKRRHRTAADTARYGTFQPQTRTRMLRTARDCLLELGRVYRDMRSGRVANENGSRLAYVLSRAAEVARQIEELEQLRGLRDQLHALQSQASNGAYSVLPPPAHNGHDVTAALEGELLPANGGGEVS